MGFEGLGARLRARVRTPAAAAVDGALGAVLTACVGLGVVWVLGAVALGSGGELRREVQRSYVLQRLNTVLPPTSGLLATLKNLDPFPRIDGPEVRVQAPSAGIVSDPQVDAAARSVVKVLGTACGLGRRGLGLGRRATGWWSRTRTWWPARRTRACCWRAASRASTPRRSPSTPATTSRCCASPGCPRPRSALAASPAARHLGRGAGLPAQRALRRARRPAGRDARGRSPRTPTAAARCGG